MSNAIHFESELQDLIQKWKNSAAIKPITDEEIVAILEMEASQWRSTAKKD